MAAGPGNPISTFIAREGRKPVVLVLSTKMALNNSDFQRLLNDADATILKEATEKK